MLFLIYVNDITEQLLCLTQLFAGDSSLFTSATDIHDTEGIINHDLIIISQWAKQWLVKFNPNKTEEIFFSLRQLNLLPNLVFDNVKINLLINISILVLPLARMVNGMNMLKTFCHHHLK